MPAPWTTIPDADLDEGDPIYEKTIRSLRDNALAIIEGHASAPRIGNGVAATVATIMHSINGEAFQDGTIASAKLPSSLLIEEDLKGAVFGGPVHLAEVKKAQQVQTNANSLANPGFNFTLTNGIFMLGYETRTLTAGGDYRFRVGVDYDLAGEAVYTSTSLLTYAWMGIVNTVGGPWTLEFTHQYINASPPYDLGNGEVAAFIMACQRPDGSVERVSVCVDPPWANLLGHKMVTKADGKTYYRRRVGRVIEEMEVTPQSKNCGMDLHPHPWPGGIKPGHRAIIIDPVSQFADDLRLLQAEGVSIGELLINGDIEIGDDLAGVGSPSAVSPVRARWR
jgi:hypothetical protein